MTDNDLEKFKIAWETRNFEIEMFWRRTNYFLLLNTSVGAGAATAAIKLGYFPFFLFCFIGMFVCFAWIKIGLGAKFWQTHWETVTAKLQHEVGFIGDQDFFSNNDRVRERVEKGLDEKQSECSCTKFFAEYTPFIPCLYKQHILVKPSVSRWMHRTACFFFGAWILAAIYALICIILVHCLSLPCVAICPVK